MAPDNETAINLYINRRAKFASDVVAQCLRTQGFSVVRNLGQTKTQLTIAKGRMNAVWDLHRMIKLIATGKDGQFDQRLSSQSYETLKTNIIIGQQLKVILIYFGDDDEEQKLAKLSQITSDSNLAIKITRRS